MIEIITVFSARLHGSRSHKTKRLLNEPTEGKETEDSGDPTEVARRVRTRDGISVPAGAPDHDRAGERSPPAQPKPLNTCAIGIVPPGRKADVVTVKPVASAGDARM